MTTTYPKDDNASDENCKRMCRLKMGSGERFKKNLAQQQLYNATKSQIEIPDIFTEANDKLLYGNFLKDVMYTIGLLLDGLITIVLTKLELVVLCLITELQTVRENVKSVDLIK